MVQPVYNFLVDLIRVQRAIGQFAIVMEQEERAGMHQRLEEFFMEAGVKIRIRKYK